MVLPLTSLTPFPLICVEKFSIVGCNKQNIRRIYYNIYYVSVGKVSIAIQDLSRASCMAAKLASSWL